MLHAGSVPETDLATWDFRVWGQVEREAALSWEEFNELPKVEVTQDIHCVTRWSSFDVTLEGVPWSTSSTAGRAEAEAHFVIAHAEQGYTANLPARGAEDDDVLLAQRADGEPLTPEHGWPLRLVVPEQLLLEERQVAARPRVPDADQPGFWERYGYHNDADPWKEERYGF